MVSASKWTYAILLQVSITVWHEAYTCTSEISDSETDCHHMHDILALTLML